jgi:hypothetical protein
LSTSLSEEKASILFEGRGDEKRSKTTTFKGFVQVVVLLLEWDQANNQGQEKNNQGQEKNIGHVTAVPHALESKRQLREWFFLQSPGRALQYMGVHLFFKQLVMDPNIQKLVFNYCKVGFFLQ